MARPGESQPALPQDAPAATPSRSTTVTSTPRSCRNQAVDRPTTPAPITTAVRGPPSIAIATSPLFRALPVWGRSPLFVVYDEHHPYGPKRSCGGRTTGRSVFVLLRQALIDRQRDDHRQP